MRTAFATSSLAHVLLVLGALFGLPGGDAREAEPTEAIEVELVAEPAPVPPEQRAPTPPDLRLPDPRPPDPPKPPPEATAAARPAPAPAAAAPPPPPPPPPPPAAATQTIAAGDLAAAQSWPTLAGATQAMPADAFDAPAADKAKLTAEDIAAFRAKVQSCWQVPAGTAEAARLTVMLRVTFKPGGALTGEPVLIAASASPLGPALLAEAKRALRACAPYAMLPADKFAEWRVLDLRFVPSGLVGG